ncbi:centromere protein F-like [Denticeps clupeoides]|uniref:centromere protein F-like n=1 Tax=Denticeps clupeoides TaxID=299321 RepID=UPI0010A377CA|nr:centromere protein F-like [Denticeps clupeoides]
MSWAVEEWKDGLPGRALQKIQEIESQLDKLKKERQQKQFQLDSLEAALQKQKQKMDSEKNESAVLKRENQSLVESCENLEKARVKVTHDFQVKEQQVNYLEGQLNSSKKQIERLEQEVKKYKSELERSQNPSVADLQPYVTPQKTTAAPPTPSYRQHDLRLEELQEKYSREFEERKRLETELKVLQVKVLNQSSVSYKDIARQQACSSIFPWQQEQAQGRQTGSVMETPSKQSQRGSGLMWNTAETPLKQNHQSALMSHSDAFTVQQAEQLRNLNQDLKAKVTELEFSLQSQDKSMKNQINRFSEIQNQLEKTKKDLADKEKELGKMRDEFSNVSSQHQQALSKCSSVEQKLKQVTEEMNCQRHNADSTRLVLEQKLKDQEKDSQKITVLKNHLEKDLEEQKQKLLRSEQGLQASQAKEMELNKNCDEIKRENNTLSSQLQQGSRRLVQLEQEAKGTEENLRHSRNVVEDLKAKTETQSEQLKSLQVKLENQSRSDVLEITNLKKTIEALEEKEMKFHEKQKIQVEQLSSKISELEQQNRDLHMTQNSKQNEIEHMKKEYESILQWKDHKKHLIQNAENDRETMLNKIGELEKNTEDLTKAHADLQERLQEQETEKLSQIDFLKGELLNKCSELEEQNRMYEEMQQKYNEVNQKYIKDKENAMVQITALQEHMKELEVRLQQEVSKIEKMEHSRCEHLAQYESACDLVKSKDAIIDLNKNEILHLKESMALQEEQIVTLMEQKNVLMKESDEKLSHKADEAEQAKLNAIIFEQEILLLKNHISPLEMALKFQKELSSELQEKLNDLLKVNEDLLKKIAEADCREKNLMNEISSLSEEARSWSSLQVQCSDFAVAAEQRKLALDKLQDVFAQTSAELQTQKMRTEELEGRINEETIKNSDFKNKYSVQSEKLKETEQEKNKISEKYQSLRELYDALSEEKNEINKKLSALSDELAEKRNAAERSATVQSELDTSTKLCAELKSKSQDLQKHHDSQIKELSSQITSMSKNHCVESEFQAQKQKCFEEQIKVLQAQVESKGCETTEAQEKLFKLREELDTCNKKFIELNDSYTMVCQNLENNRNTTLSLEQELEALKTVLVAHKSREENKEHETQRLKDKLSEKELELDRVSNNLKEKNINMNKIKVQLEMLQMDLEDNEACMNSFDSQIVELKGTISLLEEKLNKSELHKSTVEIELNDAQEQLSLKTTEISQLTACLEDAHKQHNYSLGSQLESLQATAENLKLSLETEVCRRVNIEAMHNNLTDQKNGLDSELQELKQEHQKALENIDLLKKQNDSLKEVAQNLTNESETLKDATEKATQQCELITAENAGLGGKQAVLCQQIKDLQDELVSLKDQNDNLLSQVSGQQSLFEQLHIKKDDDTFVMEPTATAAMDPISSTLPEEEEDSNSQSALTTAEASLQVNLDVLSIEQQLQQKSIELEQLSEAFEEAVRTLDDQRESQVKQLKVQHAAELQDLQQKMDAVKNDLEAKLVDERQHVEMMSSQLEVARLQMEQLDLASRSLLVDDLESLSQATEDPSVPGENDHSKLKNESSLNISSGLTSAEPPSGDSDAKPLVHEHGEESQMKQEEFQALQSNFEVLSSEMAERKAFCKDLEKKVSELEKEQSSVSTKLNAAIQEKQMLNNLVEELTNENASLKLELQTSKSQLADVLEMLESLEVSKGEWDEKFFQVECELKRTRSEKANLEKHILSMETDMDVLLEQKQRLESELELKKTNCASLEQQLNATVAEGGQLKQELLQCSEERDSEILSLIKWKEKAEILEKDHADARELIKVLEEDIHFGKRQLDEVSDKTNIMIHEKESLIQQCQALEQDSAKLTEEKDNLLKELNLLKGEENVVLRESETMVSKIQSLQEENFKLSQSLESSLLEKGGIASRLISTQEEVVQMRKGIEKLKVRIEADERKKTYMNEQLKAAQRKTDSLQDSIEKLEQEKEMSEQGLEEAILQAEITRAELEEIETEKKELMKEIMETNMKLNGLKEEKENLEKDLLQKNELTKQLQASIHEVSERLESVEKTMAGSEVNHRAIVDNLQAKIAVLENEFQSCRDQLESTLLKEQDVTRNLHSMEDKNKELGEKLVETENLKTELQSAILNIQNDLAVKQVEISSHLEENQQLLSQVTQLQSCVEEGDNWKKLQKELQEAAAQWEDKAQMQSKQNDCLVSTIASLETGVKDLENRLEATKGMNEELTEKLKVVHENNTNLQNQLEVEAKMMQEAWEQNKVTLSAQLQETQLQAQTYKQELLSENGSLKSNLEELNHAFSALKRKHETCQNIQADLTSRADQLAKEKDSSLSTMNLWMKSCKQLESEKLILSEENLKQAEQIDNLKATQIPAAGCDCNIEELKAEMKDLKEAMEEKSKEADDSMDRCCSLMVKVHKLEELNETLQNRVKQLSSQETPATSRRSATGKSTGKKNSPSSKEETEGPLSGKRQRSAVETPVRAQEALQSLAKRLRAGATPQPHTNNDDDDFRPEGLPDRVMKGEQEGC